jgi:RNA polymerase sigma factor (sigma-70 family)
MRVNRLPSRRSLEERNALIVQWQYLPRHVAKALIRKGHAGVCRMGLEDAADAGMFGLIRAAELWDEARGVLFKTYAFRSVWAAMTRASLDQGIIHVPQHASRSDTPEAMRESALQALAVTSIDRVSLESQLIDRRPAPGEAAQTSEDAERVRSLLSTLPARTRRAIKLKYFQGLTLAEVGQRIGGVSKERARQLIDGGLKAVRKRAGVSNVKAGTTA